MEHLRRPSGYKTRGQMAREYDISLSTFWRKLKEREIDLPKGLISPKWQKIIYEQLGYPPGVSGRDFE